MAAANQSRAAPFDRAIERRDRMPLPRSHRLRFQLPSILALLAALPAIASPPAPATPSPLPAAALFRWPVVRHMTLSPGGGHVATIATDERDGANLVIFDLATRASTGVGAGSDQDVTEVRWMNNERLVARYSYEKRYSMGVFVAPRDRPEQSVLINRHDVAELVAAPRARPDRMILWIKHAAPDGREGGLVEVDTRYPLGSTFLRSPRRYWPPSDGHSVGWLPDFEGEPCIALVYRDQRLHAILYTPANDSWRELALDPVKLQPIGVDPDREHLWLLDTENDNRLRRYRLADGALDEPVTGRVASPGDETVVFFSRQHRRLAGVASRGSTRRHWMDPTYAGAQQAIDAAFPNAVNELLEADESDRRFLLFSSGPARPGAYFLWEADTGTLTKLADTSPWLREARFVSRQVVEFKGRDGARLSGALYRPDGTPPSAGWPLVVIPRAVPSGAITDGFDPEVQFLASRGYAVFQPHYRASSTDTPILSSDEVFNLERMRHDVTDGTRAMLATGLFDPARVAIMGWSYGGYLALAGLTFEPDLYRCGLSVGAVTDWHAQIRYLSGISGLAAAAAVFKDKLGRPGADREHLESLSPQNHAARVRAPVFLAHGKDDDYVSLGQAKRYAAALKQAGVHVETHYAAGETNRFLHRQRRIELYEAAERFLAKHLAPPAAAR